MKQFFENAIIPDSSAQISGKICGINISEIMNPITRNIRKLDKIVDELAK